jgi:hypothetical protein
MVIFSIDSVIFPHQKPVIFIGATPIPGSGVEEMVTANSLSEKLIQPPVSVSVRKGGIG